jgi:uncharacterized membrane protein YgdD (TMEM256/DUF423 family)
MNAYSFLWLYWGIPSVILGVIIRLATGASNGVAMPIAGTLVVVGWIVIAYANSKDEKQKDKGRNQ